MAWIAVTAPASAFIGVDLAEAPEAPAEGSSATPAQSTDKAPTQSAPADKGRQPGSAFGGWMFNGQFSHTNFTGFNPSYQVAVSDTVAVRMWGAYETDIKLKVDAQGNIFIPQVGPVQVLGVRNEDLNQTVTHKVKGIFKNNVGVYAALDMAQPVKIYVTGFVRQPGLYAGLSSDSILYYLDKAGGIDPARGSFLDIELLRDGTVRQRVDLYQFLLHGELPNLQIADGDTLRVGPRRYTAEVKGLVQNPFRFEFDAPALPVSGLLDMAKPLPEATHVRVTRFGGPRVEVEYYPISGVASDLTIRDGDTAELIADKKTTSISVRVEGEHDSAQEYVLPYGAHLKDLLTQIQFNDRSNPDSIQLFRQSVKKRQKQMLLDSLKALEASVLTARSNTKSEAELRTREADLVLKWIERAHDVEPRGQVVLAGNPNAGDLLLENGDVIRVPTRTLLVQVHGEVMFPNATVWDKGRELDEYIRNAGGYTQTANNSRVIVLHDDGTFDLSDNNQWSSPTVRQGDEILVLPKVQTKTLQVSKDWMELIYQIAVSAAVVLRI